MTLQVLDIRGRTEPIDIVGNMQKGMEFRRARDAQQAHDQYKTQLRGIATGLDNGSLDPADAMKQAQDAYRASGYDVFDDPDQNGVTTHQRSMQAMFGNSQQLDTMVKNRDIAADVPEEDQGIARTDADANRQFQYGNNPAGNALLASKIPQILPHVTAAVAAWPEEGASDEVMADYAKHLTTAFIPLRGPTGLNVSFAYDPHSKAIVSAANGQPQGAFHNKNEALGFLTTVMHPESDPVAAGYATQVKGAQDQVAARNDTAKAARDAKLEIIKKAGDVLGKFDLPAFKTGIEATSQLNASGWTVVKSIDTDNGSTVLMQDKQGQQVVAKLSGKDTGLGGAVTYETPDGLPVDPAKMGAPLDAMRQTALAYGAMSSQAKALYTSQFLQFQLGAVDAITGQGAPAAGDKALPGPQANGAPRGIRNNNPGNLRDGVKFKGMTGSDGQFGTFGTMADGIRAAATNLQTYQNKHGLATVQDIINRWAPPGDNNDTSAYVAQVARQMGVDPGQKLDLSNKQTLQSLLGAIFQHENGQPVDPQLITAAIGGQDRPNDGLPARPDFSSPVLDAKARTASTSPAPMAAQDVTASIADYLRIR